MNKLISVGLAAPEDLADLTHIYNQAIRRGGCTGDTEEFSPADRRSWFAGHDEKYPLLTATLGGRIAGYITLSPYRKGRQGLRFTAEVSYYVGDEFQRRGVGSSLMEAALAASSECGFKTLLAVLYDANVGSIRLLEKYGFQRWGHLPGVIEVDDKVFGHYIYGRRL